MLTTNPFAALVVPVPPAFLQAYVVLMIALVVVGTLFDIIHKGNAKYFFNDWRKAKTKRTRKIGGGEIASSVLKSAVVDVLMSGEFCNSRRRIAHLLTMYGFLIYLITTVIMIFRYDNPAVPTPRLLPMLWTVGALMICVGGYWFWFFIRVDVTAEGNSRFRVVRADLFVLSLLANATTALIWAYTQFAGYAVLANVFLGLYVIATTVLFGSIPWSKFAHMFFKPAAALQKRLELASGQWRNLPAAADKPATFGRASTQPRHF